MNFKKSSSIAFLIVSIFVACSTNKDQADTTVSDSTQVDIVDTTEALAENITTADAERPRFAGEYLVGEGDLYIVPVGDTYEIQDGTGKATDVFYFQGIENDTLSIYSNKDKSITFKMNPDHKTGRYYSADEQLPVEYVGILP